jgi:hypothetical protein
MAILSYETRADAAARLRAAADLIEAGDVKGAGVALLGGLAGVAAELKAAYGPLAKIVIQAKLNDLFR